MQRLGGILFLILAFGSLPSFAQEAWPLTADAALLNGIAWESDEVPLSCDGSVFDVVDWGPGIGGVTVLGQREWRLQIWLDPKNLAAHDLTPTDVPKALMPSGIANDTSHAVQVAWRGAFLLEVFGTPVQPFRGEFGNVILRATSEGQVVRLKDVARLELRAR